MPPWGNGPLQSKIYEGVARYDVEFPDGSSARKYTAQHQGIDKAYEQDASLRDDANWSVAALLLASNVLDTW
jgi:hypothetical protein